MFVRVQLQKDRRKTYKTIRRSLGCAGYRPDLLEVGVSDSGVLGVIVDRLFAAEQFVVWVPDDDTTPLRQVCWPWEHPFPYSVSPSALAFPELTPCF